MPLIEIQNLVKHFGPIRAVDDLSFGVEAGTAGGELAQVGAAVVLAGTTFALLGVAVGFLTRSQAPAVVTVFAVFFAEKLFGPALGEASGYLPYSLLNSLLELDGPLPVGVAALVLTATAVALSCLAATTAARRDVA
jgi:hypothetical protein